MSPIDYDAKLLRTMFGKPIRPTIAISSSEVSLEAQRLAGKLSISGVQPKLSMRLDGDRLISVARDGQFILKPQTQEFAELPTNEYLCMSMGKRFGLRVPPCLLLELSDGTPAYVVKRFDRYKEGRRIEKRACEDMQQILGGPDKYAGSHEQIARAVRQHCTFVPLELQRLFEVVIFNFAIGNGDAHRKNFSLLTSQDGTIALSPAYDLVSSRLAIPAESAELALMVNGKRNGLRRTDFLAFAESISIAPDYRERQIAKLVNLRRTFTEMIDASLLSSDLRDRLSGILTDRLDRLR